MTRAEWHEHEAKAAWARRAVREGEAARTYGHRRGAIQCFTCYRFKGRPSDVCASCGDDPVGNAAPGFADRLAFDQAHGYAR